MEWLSKSWILLAAAVFGIFVLAVAGCSDDDESNTEAPTSPDLNRTYVQIERLGNPLVSEVLFLKRDHGHHNATGPNTDVANFTDDVETFVTTVAGRSQQLATTLSSVLLPDMLIVDTSKAAPVGWLTWALASGYGGRTLSEDVVDAGLGALFGTVVIADADTTECLASDNVPANDVAIGSTFPYLANPH
jgi:hypothetical protein